MALRVSEDGRRLVRPDGRAFFWLADTAWELFHRLGYAEARHYLDVRAAQGFTVVQAVLIPELDGLDSPNRYGETPLIGRDPTRPNSAWFHYVDEVVRYANAQGLLMALLPTWGDKVRKAWGEGPEIFTPDNAYLYGRFLGRRYVGADVVWVLGGDRSPQTEREKATWDGMAQGLRETSRHLVTFHPQGGDNSARYFHDRGWLAFDMIQSGHAERNLDNGRMLLENLALAPTKPALDGEPRYEDVPIAFDQYKREDEWPRYTEEEVAAMPRMRAADVRQAAWFALTAGACGHTYGHNCVWQMWDPRHAPNVPALLPWREALLRPGAGQMGFVRRCFAALDLARMRPRPDVAVELETERTWPRRVLGTPEGDTLLVYSPGGDPVRLDVQERGSWFDPRSGEWHPASGPAWVPPSRGEDWVLVVGR